MSEPSAAIQQAIRDIVEEESRFGGRLYQPPPPAWPFPPVPDPPVTGNLAGGSIKAQGFGPPLGEHKDAGKTRLDLVDARWIEATGKVLGFGAEKYDPWNWTRGIVYTKLIGSALRHIFAFCRREDLDPESGLPHLAHASCCLMMLYGMTVRHPEMDDRVEGV